MFDEVSVVDLAAQVQREVQAKAREQNSREQALTVWKKLGERLKVKKKPEATVTKGGTKKKKTATKGASPKQGGGQKKKKSKKDYFDVEVDEQFDASVLVHDGNGRGFARDSSSNVHDEDNSPYVHDGQSQFDEDEDDDFDRELDYDAFE